MSEQRWHRIPDLRCDLSLAPAKQEAVVKPLNPCRLARRNRAIIEWMNAAVQLGRAVPAPASLGQWRQRVPRSLHEKLKIRAAQEGVSLNALVTSVLAEAVGKRALG